MREIKFRAWNKRVKRFVLVDHIASFTDKEEGKLNIMDGVELMQYTGWLDKNGVEIYEGDACKNVTQDSIFAIVSFYKGRFIMTADNGDAIHHHFSELSSNCEVIGNIYENPKLFENK